MLFEIVQSHVIIFMLGAKTFYLNQRKHYRITLLMKCRICCLIGNFFSALPMWRLKYGTVYNYFRCFRSVQ